MSQVVRNLGTGGSALNAQLGSTSSADSNDPKYLDWQGENYIYLPGVAGNYLSVPDEAALDITGDIDIRVRVALDDWTPNATQMIVAKRAVINQGSYSLAVTATGLLRLDWTPDGSVGALISKPSTVATAISDGDVKWVRATLDVDNGASGNDVRFFTSDDGVTWTQLGATVTTAGVTSIFASTSIVEIGSRSSGAGDVAAARVYRAQVLDGIDGTTVLDVDTSVISSGAATSFTALTGQTVTINRATSGRKSVAVVAPVWLFGTDDYMEVPDNDLLDFGASDSFTVLAIVRQWNTPPSNSMIITKSVNSSSAGRWAVFNSGTSQDAVAAMGELGSSVVTSTTSGAVAGGLKVLALNADRVSDDLIAYLNGSAASAGDISSVGDVGSSSPLYVGRVDGIFPVYSDMEFIAAAVFRRALTATEIQLITDYYAARWV